ncbi:hypothetical protein TCON_0613 [Astathelohania contejeani]|uniref:Uncharacterized protein n=1 Tax=Astathelohania contejeani TaxID=164912 RepID=A0ABQ7I147_9MICR|nr:hypothetical protein TCON_0613 [Thelohania contejeani]
MEQLSIDYLLSLAYYYKEIDGEKYILSKLKDIPPHVQSLFCPTCLHFFILTVNCISRMNDTDFTIKCKKCNYKLCVELEVERNNTKEYTTPKFEDFFIKE